MPTWPLAWRVHVARLIVVSALAQIAVLIAASFIAVWMPTAAAAGDRGCRVLFAGWPYCAAPVAGLRELIDLAAASLVEASV